MNNLFQQSYSAPTVVKVIEDINDVRAIITINNVDNVGFFLASEGKPYVFTNVDAAEEYAKEHTLENYEVEPFIDYDFSGIELIEL